METPSERLTFYRLDSLPGAEFMSVRDTSRRWRIYHLAYCFCAQWSTSAAAEYDYRSRRSLAPPDEVIAFEPGEVHAVQKLYGVGNFEVLSLDPDALGRLAPEIHLRPGFLHFGSSQARGPDLVRAFRTFFAATFEPSSALELQSRLVACLRKLAEQIAETPPLRVPSSREPVAVKRVRDHLVDRFDENVSLAELAASSGLSYYHLLRTFKQRYGVPPHAFQLQVRLAKARTLLSRQVSPAAVAAAVGFSDQSHLHRHFRRAFGITPAAYSRSLTRP